MRLDYWLYMNEAEGYDNMVDTRQARVNAVGRELRDMGYAGRVVPTGVFASLLMKHKLNDITQAEINYIEKEWI